MYYVLFDASLNHKDNTEGLLPSCLFSTTIDYLLLYLPQGLQSY